MTSVICPICKQHAFDLEEKTCRACGARALAIGLMDPPLEDVLAGLVEDVKLMIKDLKDDDYQQLLGLWVNVPFTKDTALLAHRCIAEAGLHCMQVHLTIKGLWQYSLILANTEKSLKTVETIVRKIAKERGAEVTFSGRPLLH
jgi:hypothetical protein